MSHLGLGLEEPCSLLLGEITLEYVVKREKVHLSLQLQEHVPHE